MKISQFIKLVILASIWGSSYIFIRLSVEEFGAVQLTAARSGIATAFLVPLFLFKGHWPAFKQYWKHIFVLAMISTALPFSFMTISTQYSSAGFASILNALSPIFTAIIAWIWLKNYLSLAAMIGIGLSFIGVIAMVVDTGTVASSISLLPVICGLIAAGFYGLTGNYSAQFLTSVPPLAIAAGSQVFSAIILIPVAVFIWPEHSVSATSWLCAATLGILCTSLGYILFFQLIEQVGATKTMIVTYLIPVFAIIWGVLFLNETVSINMLLGAGFILTGITLTSGILTKKQPVVTHKDINHEN